MSSCLRSLITLFTLQVSLGPNLTVEPGSRFSLQKREDLDELMEDMSIDQQQESGKKSVLNTVELFFLTFTYDL